MDPKWQLMEQTITIQEFEDLPLLRSTFFHYNLGMQCCIFVPCMVSTQNK